MPVSTSERTHRIVHVVAGPDQTTAPVSAVLAACAGACESFRDVYSAMAAVARHVDSAMLTVVACVDELLESQMEFFRILKRDYSRTAVFAYADARRSQALAHARRLGASDITALADHVRRLDLARAEGQDVASRSAAPVSQAMATPSGGQEGPRPARSLGAAESLVPGAPPPACEPAPQAAAVRPPRTRRARSTAPPPSPQVPPDTAETPPPAASRARVPWMRYNDRPERTPPRRPPQPASDGPVPAATAADSDDAPLLTAEELSALLGDPAAFEDRRADAPRSRKH